MNSVLIDTNLLIMLIVGSLGREHLGRTKGVKQYDADSFEMLVLILEDYQKHVTIPNVLTEASNLLRGGRKEIVPGATDRLAEYAAQAEEVCESSIEAMTISAYKQFGLSDAAITRVSQIGITVITDDAPLSAFLENSKLSVVNFSHYRTPIL